MKEAIRSLQANSGEKMGPRLGGMVGCGNGGSGDMNIPPTLSCLLSIGPEHSKGGAMLPRYGDAQIQVQILILPRTSFELALKHGLVVSTSHAEDAQGPVIGRKHV